MINGFMHLFKDVDAASRAFIIAISTDLYFCVLAPMLVLYAVPAVRKKYLSFSKKVTLVEPFDDVTNSCAKKSVIISDQSENIL